MRTNSCGMKRRARSAHKNKIVLLLVLGRVSERAKSEDK